MATIPTVALSAVPVAPALGPRADAGAFASVGRAVAGAGGALAEVGDRLGRIALLKQEQVNRGILAAEETERMKAAGAVAAFAQANPDKPEEWEKVEAETWKAYEDGRSKRAQTQGWGSQVKALDEQAAAGYKQETAIRFRAQRDAALIRQSNARLEGNAREHLANGNVKAAVASIKGMTLFDDQRADMLAQVTNGAEYEKANRTLSDVEQAPVATQVEELARLETLYTEQNGRGEFVNGFVEDEEGNRVGGLGINARNDIIQRIRAQKEQAGRAQVRSLAPILDAFEAGGLEAGNAAANAAIERGEVTWDFMERMGPAMRGAAMKREEKLTKEAEAAAKAEQARSRAQFERFNTLKGKVDELTPREVMEREKNGDISPAQAKELRARMSGLALVELDMARPLTNAKGVEVKKGADPRVIVDAYVARYATSGRDATVEEREAALTSIATAPIATETKAALMRKLIQGFDTDFRVDYRTQQVQRALEYKVMPGTFPISKEFMLRSGRKITAAEAEIRSSIYRTLMTSDELGQRWTADALMKAERELTDTFSNRELTIEQAREVGQRLTREIADQASLVILDGIVKNR